MAGLATCGGCGAGPFEDHDGSCRTQPHRRRIREWIVNTLLYEKVAAEMWDIIDTLVKHLVRKTLGPELKGLVDRVVAEEIPQSQRYKLVRDEVRMQLRRWPALASDPQMFEEVSRTILRSFMR